MTQVSDAYTSQELTALGPLPTYDGYLADQIAFPFGGIGTGCVSLTARGALVDWEIFNRPNKGTILPYSFFTLWARAARPGAGDPRAPRRRPAALHRPGGRRHRASASASPARTAPACRTCASADLPRRVPLRLGRVRGPGSAGPGQPGGLQPLHPAEPGRLRPAHRRAATTTCSNTSGLPVTRSHRGQPVQRRRLSRHRPFHGRAPGRERQRVRRRRAGYGAFDSPPASYAAGSHRFGSMALSTPWKEVFHQKASAARWLVRRYARLLGPFLYQRHPAGAGRIRPPMTGQSDVGIAGAASAPGPGRERYAALLHHLALSQFHQVLGRQHRFLRLRRRRRAGVAQLLRHPVVRCRSTWPTTTPPTRTRLYGRDRTLPRLPVRLSAAALRAGRSLQPGPILHSPTVLAPDRRHLLRLRGLPLRLRAAARAPAPTCGTTPRRWPSSSPLWSARCARPTTPTTCARTATWASGCSCRWAARPSQFHAAADGQLGGIIKVYRDWRLCGDDEWLRSLWPKVKKALEYAWQQWDPDRDGVIDGMQHNTYDIEFYGPNSMIGAFYLGALRAAEEMARHLGEDAVRPTSTARSTKAAAARMDAQLFNGEYYVQKPGLGP